LFLQNDLPDKNSNIFKGKDRCFCALIFKSVYQKQALAEKKSDTCLLQQVSEINKPINGILNIRPVIS